MANVYFGDSIFTATDGNWNNVANWFSALGGCCCGPFPGTPLGRLPAPGDSVVIAQARTGPGITTGPVGGWAGPVSWLQTLNITDPGPQPITTGTYSGPVTVQNPPGYSASTRYAEITGGNFSGAVSLVGSVSGTLGAIAPPAISGGTFTGSVSRTGNNTASIINGGTYSPTANVTLNSADQVVPTNITADPGFKEGGGTFSPVLNVTGNVYPPVADVLTGTHYGPTGADFTGTLVPGSGSSTPPPWPFNQEAA